jgi:hypothetical protein
MFARSFFLLAVLLVVPVLASAADPPAPDGWTLTRYSATTCAVDGPQDGSVQLSIAAFGPQILMVLSSIGEADKPGTYPVTLSFDDGPDFDVNAEGHDRSLGIALTPRVGQGLRMAKLMTATIDGMTYKFPLQNAVEAMDAASHCAGAETYAEQRSHPPRAIAGAGDWQLLDDMPDDTCSARLGGEHVDTMLMRANDGKLILAAGRPDWAFPAQDADITLQIDDEPPLAITAPVITNLVLAHIPDAEMDHLRHATRLIWHLPWGDFAASVDGLGTAFDAVAACETGRGRVIHP